MLNNAFGIFLYLLLPTHWVWRLLSNIEREIILDACYNHNNAQYALPENYDREHERQGSPESTEVGKFLQHALQKYSPGSVLEFGPGSGFFTRQIFNAPSVKQYCAVDIVQPCLDYVKEGIAAKQTRIKSEFICGDFLKQEFGQKYDLIIFMSTLHHIPNRVEYLKKCAALLSNRGTVIIIEPTHRVIRIFRLIWRFFRKYRKKSFWQNRNNLSTHSFITMLEIRHLRRKCNLKINEVVFFSIAGARFVPPILRSKIGFLHCSALNPISMLAQQIYVSFSV